MKFPFLRAPPNRAVIDRLHGEIMAAARQPALYLDYGIPDTFEGRFEALALMAVLPVRRLMELPAPGPGLAQELTDLVFLRFDDALREAGISDIAVPKRIQKLAAAWLGRRLAYSDALAASGDGPLEAALARNVHGGALPADAAPVRRLAGYVRRCEALQAGADLPAYQRGPAPFAAAALEDSDSNG